MYQFGHRLLFDYFRFQRFYQSLTEKRKNKDLAVSLITAGKSSDTKTGTSYKPLNAKQIMSKVFEIRPKRTIRRNNQVLTPDMSITVTTKLHTYDPFYNGAKEIQERYMALYGFDYKRACCNKNDFDYEALD